MKRLALISDTHGHLSQRVHRALDGVELILHAGDIGGDEILAELETVAPVLAVRGNTDRQDYAATLPSIRRLQLEGHNILLVHDLQTLGPDDLNGVGVVIHGHTHRARKVTRGKTLFVNPGSAARPRDGSASLAFLELSPEQIRVEIVPI